MSLSHFMFSVFKNFFVLFSNFCFDSFFIFFTKFHLSCQKPVETKKSQTWSEIDTDSHSVWIRSFSHTHKHTNTHTHKNTHAQTYTRTKTHTHTHKHAQKHTHAQTHTLCFLSLFYPHVSLILSLSLFLNKSFCLYYYSFSSKLRYSSFFLVGLIRITRFQSSSLSLTLCLPLPLSLFISVSLSLSLSLFLFISWVKTLTFYFVLCLLFPISIKNILFLSEARHDSFVMVVVVVVVIVVVSCCCHRHCCCLDCCCCRHRHRRCRHGCCRCRHRRRCCCRCCRHRHSCCLDCCCRRCCHCRYRRRQVSNRRVKNSNLDLTSFVWKISISRQVSQTFNFSHVFFNQEFSLGSGGSCCSRSLVLIPLWLRLAVVSDLVLKILSVQAQFFT